MASCSSSKDPSLLPITSDPLQESERFSRLSSFARDFYRCDSDDDDGAIDGVAGLHDNYNDITEKIGALSIKKIGALSIKEARAKFRLELLTGSQWDMVMESCKISVQIYENVADKVVKVMEWRGKRGDFDMHGDAEEDEELFLVDAEVPRLCDDMEGVTEACLKLGFLKTDLQVECLLRKIPYDGCDTKAQLISKLMDHKQTLSENCRNSFQILAEECK